MLSAFPVTTIADSGIGSLRQAILDANGSTGADTITFNITGLGTHTIQPLSPLPVITDPVIIDGTSQPGWTGRPLIQLDGSLAGANATGLSITAGSSTVEGLDITGFAGTAIVLQTGGSNVVRYNYVGIDVTGTIANGNQGDGLAIYGGSANNQVIQNVISANGFTAGAANGFAAVFVGGAGTNGNVFTGNFVGTDADGAVALGNGGVGFYVANGAQNTQIGTNGDGVSDTAERNIISGNTYDGIVIQGTSSGANTTGTIVAGNYIGTNVMGTSAVPNHSDGIFIFGGAASNRIGVGGSDVNPAAEQNLISGNAYQGVAISDAGSNINIVAGNLIGTDVSGTKALPNVEGGIDILNGASFNRIGFDGVSSTAVAALERNVISGNGSNPGYAGIYVSGTGSNFNDIAGNYIGVDATGAAALGNTGVGVYLANGAQNNRIGTGGSGPASVSNANLIAFNDMAGVAVVDSSTTGNSIRANNIYSNGGIGIDLGDSGVQTNHSPAASGPNNLQNYPLITAGTPGPTTVVQGTLNGAPATTYTIDFYASLAHDVTFYGPGQRYLGAISATTDATGAVDFSASLAAPTSAGDWVSATATDPAGNTSEFCGDRQLPYSTPALSTSTWTPLGPFAIAQSPEYSGPVMSGRMETAVPDPSNANIMYVAADGGGVWKTNNWLSDSPTWKPLTDSQPSTVTGSGDLAYKSLVIYPGNPAILYAAVAGPGGGILKSSDGGGSWTLMGSPVFDSAAFGSLVIDPRNANNLYVSVWYGPNSNSGGVYRSTNGGVTWANTTAAIHIGAASDIAMDPTNSLILYAGLTQGAGGGSTNGLYKTTDGGQTWTRLTGGILTGSAVGVSVRVAIAPSSAQTIYATVFDPALGSAPSGLPHRYRSSDGGATWISLAGLPTNDESRYWHVALSVSPTAPQTIYVNGDHTLYVSTDGGADWTLLNNFEDPVGVYFDDSGSLVVTGDHGIYHGTNFVNKQGNLQTSEFYTLTLDPTDPSIAFGLAQDQFAAVKYTGYQVWNSTGQAPNNQDGAGAGEVGKILVDPTSPNKLYRFAPTDTSSLILSSTDGGATWIETGTGVPTALASYGLAYASQKAFVMDPSNPQRLLVGTNELYESKNGSASWTAFSPVLSPSSVLTDQYITAVAIAPSNPSVVYAATADGRMFVTQNDGGAWAEVDSGLPIDTFDQIVSIQVDPNNASRAFIVPGRFPTNVFGSTHVWMTTTGGAGGWTDITGNLPQGDWTNSIAADWRPATPVLYVATARGVYQSADLGSYWSQFGESLPNSPVTDLQLVPGLNILAAATYGRGVWEIRLAAVNRVWSGQGTTANWNDANNWTDHAVPQPGDNLIFPSGAGQLTNFNNLPAGTPFGNIVFGSGRYSLNGNAIALDGAIDTSGSTGNTSFNIGVTLTGASNILTGDAASKITLTQAIDTKGFPLAIGGGAGQAAFTAAIAGAGGVSITGGSVVLSGTNTYAGNTIVSVGTLIVGFSSSLFDGSSLTVGAGAAFAFNSAIAAAKATSPAASALLADPAIPQFDGSSGTSTNRPVSAAPMARQMIASVVTATARPYTVDPAWLVAWALTSWSDNRRHKGSSSVQASDAVLAKYLL